MLMRAATVVQQLCKSCRTCFMFYCMFYFTCDRSFSKIHAGPGTLSFHDQPQNNIPAPGKWRTTCQSWKMLGCMDALCMQMIWSSIFQPRIWSAISTSCTCVVLHFQSRPVRQKFTQAKRIPNLVSSNEFLRVYSNSHSESKNSITSHHLHLSPIVNRLTVKVTVR